MKIDFLCPSGSPIGITGRDVYTRGLGGAELALVSLAEVLAKRGHQVAIYNNPMPPGLFEGVMYRTLGAFDPQGERDAVVLFRCPHPALQYMKGKRIFWSCDQYTAGSYPDDIFPYVQQVVCISERHAAYFEEVYGLQKESMMVVNLGVRDWDYPTTPVERVHNRLIYCSVPDRGVKVLANIWPRIKKQIPDATLTITGDYRLWGFDAGDHQFRLDFIGAPGVSYFGAVPRKQLCELQMQAEIQSFPCTYDEMFCIAAAECSWAGAVPVTSNYGALPTTNILGIRVAGDPRSPQFQDQYVQQIVSLLTDKRWLLNDMRSNIQAHARGAFSWEGIALIWEWLLLK